MFSDPKSLPSKSFAIHIQRETVDKLLLWEYRDILDEGLFRVRMNLPIRARPAFPLRNLEAENDSRLTLAVKLMGFRCGRQDLMRRFLLEHNFAMRPRPEGAQITQENSSNPISYSKSEFLADAARDVYRPDPASFDGVSFIETSSFLI